MKSIVTPAQAGVQLPFVSAAKQKLDASLRWHDGIEETIQ